MDVTWNGGGGNRGGINPSNEAQVESKASLLLQEAQRIHFTLSQWQLSSQVPSKQKQGVGQKKSAAIPTGLSKLIRFVQSEITYLEKFLSASFDELKHDQPTTNLPFLKRIVDVLFAEFPRARHILRSFRPLSDTEKEVTLQTTVPLVLVSSSSHSDPEQMCWVYMKNLKNETLQSCLQDAREILRIAMDHSFQFQRPRIIFKFPESTCPSYLKQVSDVFAEKMGDSDLIVQHDSSDPFSNDQTSFCSNSILVPPSSDQNQVINFDSSTLIALISLTSHQVTGIPPDAFSNVALALQRQQELDSPFLQWAIGKTLKRPLVATQTAVNSFLSIALKIGGSFERSTIARLFRFEDLNFLIHSPGGWEVALQQNLINIFKENDKSSLGVSVWLLGNPISVVPDNPSPAFIQLKDHPVCPRHLTEQNIQIFGTADHHQWFTMTANSWIQRALRSCRERGLLPAKSVIDGVILVHDPRSLIEARCHRFLKYGDE